LEFAVDGVVADCGFQTLEMEKIEIAGIMEIDVQARKKVGSTRKVSRGARKERGRKTVSRKTEEKNGLLQALCLGRGEPTRRGVGVPADGPGCAEIERSCGRVEGTAGQDSGGGAGIGTRGRVRSLWGTRIAGGAGWVAFKAAIFFRKSAGT
jgi:hypothetical protein